MNALILSLALIAQEPAKASPQQAPTATPPVPASNPPGPLAVAPAPPWAQAPAPTAPATVSPPPGSAVVLYLGVAPGAQPLAAMGPAPLPPVASPSFGWPQPVSPQPYAYQAQASLAATTQSFSMPTTRSASTFRVQGPGPIASTLARLGQRMTALGKTRIVSTQELEMGSSFVQPSGGLATFQATGTTPVVAPHPGFALPQLPPAPVAPPEPPLASPQAQPRHFRLFGR